METSFSGRKLETVRLEMDKFVAFCAEGNTIPFIVQFQIDPSFSTLFPSLYNFRVIKGLAE